MDYNTGTTVDYLIVGSGLFGAICAYEATQKGKRCIVIEKRNHIGGNIYDETINGINVHKYGAHIFHTSNENVWKYINQFAEFNNYINSPIAVYHDEIYNLPFNMNTFSKMWNIKTPQEAKAIIEKQIAECNIGGEPKNLEEQAMLLVGKDVYQKLIKGYTEKQWGRCCTELPSFIIKRLPLRFVYDNNYFNDRYQGIPIGGYTKIIEKLLKDVEVKCNTDYFDYIKNNNFAKKTIYSGMIDRYFSYKFGELEYRSLRFETEELELDNFQGNAVVNYTDKEVPYTRIIEHKHFEFGKQPNTIISKEYSKKWKNGEEPYYPLNNKMNNDLYKKYRELGDKEKNVLFGGRLGEYKYYDMEKVIESALKMMEEELK